MMDSLLRGCPPRNLQLIGGFYDQWDPNVKEEILDIMKDERASEEHEALLDDKDEYQYS